VSVAKGTKFAGSELDYWQLTPELRGYASHGGAVLAARARVGLIYGDVPVTERYYAGGTSSQRGFSERQLAPRVILDDSGCSNTGHDTDPPRRLQIAIGGAGLIETGIELRRQIVTLWDIPLGANLFFEGAEVTCNVADLVPPPEERGRASAWLSKLHWATGSGIWVHALGLKIHGDIGYRLNHRSDIDLPATGTNAFTFHGDLAWHVGIGETF